MGAERARWRGSLAKVEPGVIQEVERLLVLLRYKLVDFSGHCPGAAWTSLKAATECDGQVPSDGGDRMRRVAFGSDRGIRGVDNLGERQVRG